MARERVKGIVKVSSYEQSMEIKSDIFEWYGALRNSFRMSDVSTLKVCESFESSVTESLFEALKVSSKKSNLQTTT